MLYQGDAHHYRAMIKRKQRKQRALGSALVTLSIALMFYAIPCFAVSVFDYDDQVPGGIAFSSSVNDHDGSTVPAVAQATAEPAEGAAAANAASTAAAVVMSETIGPAMLSNDAAVDSAIKRAEAMQVVTSAQNTMVTAQAVPEAPVEQPDRNLVPALVAFFMAVVCAILGLRMITHSRQMLGRRITAEYGSALRAC
ncbi:hypothetical protein [Adlercreutzia murintestinalis]|uniref:hypothetical protein n=1 Tax=Adlercreutzia murintestinalis TaxID=2941325 RepID=UPI00203C5862|nr:hypothetical protein [Adlercreutzia murintestinalis]